MGGGFWLGGFGIGGSKAPKALAEFKGEYELVADAAWSPDAIAIALGVGLALCDLFGSSTSATADPAACAVLEGDGAGVSVGGGLRQFVTVQCTIFLLL